MTAVLGDHLASLIAVDYILKNYTWLNCLIWVPDYLLELTSNLLQDSLRPNSQIYKLSEMRGKYQPKRPTKTTQWDGVVSPMKTHGVDYAFMKLCDENPSIEYKNYLKVRTETINVSKFNLSNYIVLTTGYTAKVREFPAKTINEIAMWCSAKGISVVFLGQKQTPTGVKHVIKGNFDTEIDFSLGTNLIDQTTLLEAAAIMQSSKAVIGVDNGLLHLAACTDVPIIAGFTTVTPELRTPVRNNIQGLNYYTVVPDESLKCRFCQVKTNFLYGHRYDKCIYSDNACTSHMTSDKFIAHLLTIFQ